jgi:hypothetical protein
MHSRGESVVPAAVAALGAGEYQAVLDAALAEARQTRDVLDIKGAEAKRVYDALATEFGAARFRATAAANAAADNIVPHLRAEWNARVLAELLGTAPAVAAPAPVAPAVPFPDAGPTLGEMADSTAAHVAEVPAPALAGDYEVSETTVTRRPGALQQVRR